MQVFYSANSSCVLKSLYLNVSWARNLHKKKRIDGTNDDFIWDVVNLSENTFGPRFKKMFGRLFYPLILFISQIISTTLFLFHSTQLFLMYVFAARRSSLIAFTLLTSPFDWELSDWRCVMRPRSSHIHHDVTVSNSDLNYRRLASFQHML